ncbi:hypothetical protein ECFRIK1997_3359, partial [Escherichia coli FRIK1997]
KHASCKGVIKKTKN